MTLYLAGEAGPRGIAPKGGLVHRLVSAARTACGRTPANTWHPAAWSPPAGCCKTCARGGST